MSHPVVQHLRANHTENHLAREYRDGLFETDHTARFVLQPGEAAITTLNQPAGIRGVFAQRGGRPVVLCDRTDLLNWEITVTDRRVLFWSAMSSGLLTGFKHKPSKATGGYLEHQHITELGLLEPDAAGVVRVFMTARFAGIENWVTLDATASDAQTYCEAAIGCIKERCSQSAPQCAPAIATTIGNYLRTVIAGLPSFDGRTLSIAGPVAVVLNADSKIDRVLTDVDGYQAAGVGFD